MRTVFRLQTLGVLALAAAAACGTAQAAAGWAATKTLKHDVGTATQGLPMQAGETVHVAIALKLRDQAGLDALTTALMSGRSSRHITSAEFMARHAPTDAQVAAVVAHLGKAGFVNIKVAGNHMLVSADGTAATVKAGFNTELRHFNVDGRDAYANVADAQVPTHLAGIVSAVHGLQDVHAAHTMHQVMTEAQAPQATAASGTAVGHNPMDFPSIYDANGLPPATNSTIAIISEGDISQTLSDLTAFATNNSLDQPVVQEVVVGAPGTDTSGVIEWNMDSQSSLAAAGGKVKKMIFYVSTTLQDAPLTEAYNQAVTDNVAQAINVSLGECETAAANSGIEATDDAIFQVAVAQGQVFSVSSGDSGSFECGKKTGGQSYPAVSPYVMAIGGTLVKTTNTTTWAAETVWACSSSLACQLAGGTGGGVSTTENAPAWQVSSGVLGTSTKRGVPDIAFDGSPNSGALVLNNGKTTQVGGTSLSAPLFAGFWARIQSKNNNTLVYPASAIYSYGHVAANAKNMFHDITKGSNGGYTAAAGWDNTTGFGTLDVGKFSAFIDTHTGF
jgi:pseudomonalisin/xanthomonalisin